LVFLELAVNLSVIAPYRRLVRSLAALGMLGLWLITFAVAASPQLHRLVHSDAQGPLHQCVATQVGGHSLLLVCTQVTVPSPTFSPVTLPTQTPVQSFGAREFRLSPSRAPPLFFSSSTVAG
jgi:hypothetical protein